MALSRSMFVLLAVLLLAPGCGGDDDAPLDATQADVAASDAAVGVDGASDVPGELVATDLVMADMVGDTTAEVVPDAPVDTAAPFCLERAPLPPTEGFFVDVSDSSGMRVGNYLLDNPVKVPINDHSRLGFADINGDGFDDMVFHSLFPNPQAGVPFEHLVFVNNGDGTFTDFSDESGLRHVQSGSFAFADVDNDGDQDCFASLDVPLAGYTHEILLNDGQGHFTVLEGSGVDGTSLPPVAANAVFADFDGDVDLDLYVGTGHTSYAAPDLYFSGNGDGTFTYVPSALPGNPQQPTNGTTTCDWDDDGDLDIFVSTYGVSTDNGLNILWRNDGGTFTNVAVEMGFASLPTGNYYLPGTGYGADAEPGMAPGTYMGSNGFGIDCGDVDNDGLWDIFLTTISHPVEYDYNRKWSDPTQLLVNQGSAGGYTLVNTFLDKGLPFNEGDVDGAMVDFDNDGRLDLSISRDKKYEGNYDELDQKAWFGLMHQLPDGTFESLGPVSGINDLDATLTASMTDCTTDDECPSSEACLFSKCRTPCATSADCPQSAETCAFVWNDTLGGHQGFCKLLLKMKNAQNHAWSDIDHDGDLDLLVGGRDTGGGRPNFLFQNTIGQDNRWMAFSLVGDGVNVTTDPIGAKVTVTSGETTIIRQVKSGRGMHTSMDTRILHLGLGDLPCDYTIAVWWPDGETATFQAGDLPEETFLTVSYPDQVSW